MHSQLAGIFQISSPTLLRLFIVAVLASSCVKVENGRVKLASRLTPPTQPQTEQENRVQLASLKPLVATATPSAPKPQVVSPAALPLPKMITPSRGTRARLPLPSRFVLNDNQIQVFAKMDSSQTPRPQKAKSENRETPPPGLVKILEGEARVLLKKDPFAAWDHDRKQRSSGSERAVIEVPPSEQPNARAQLKNENPIDEAFLSGERLTVSLLIAVLTASTISAIVYQMIKRKFSND